MTDEKDSKPELSVVVSLSQKKKEIEELHTQLQEEGDLTQIHLKRVYKISRKLFSEIYDYDIQIEATNYLRKAFLLAMNPLHDIDSEFDEYLTDEDQEED